MQSFCFLACGLACAIARAGTLMPRADGRDAIGANCNHHSCRSESDRHGLVVTIWFDHIFVAGVSKACPRRVRQHVHVICQEALQGMLSFGVMSVGVRGVSVSVST